MRQTGAYSPAQPRVEMSAPAVAAFLDQPSAAELLNPRFALVGRRARLNEDQFIVDRVDDLRNGCWRLWLTAASETDFSDFTGE